MSQTVSKEYKRIPIKREIFSDTVTPIHLLQKLLNVSKHCFLLESAEDNKVWGRYTFLGYNPLLELSCRNHKLTIKGIETMEMEVEHPKEIIKKILEDYNAPKLPDMPPFTGGFVGYFSYDYIKYAEPSLHLDSKDEEDFKDVDLMLFHKVIVFDHYKQKILLITNIETENQEEAYQTGLKELDEMEEIIRNGKPRPSQRGRLLSPVRTLFDKDEYCKKVEYIKEKIREGDLFQLVLSNRLDADFKGDLLDVYRVLRTLNPSPYMFYFSSPDMELAGASPETLVKVRENKITTFPLAGTRPRGKNEKEDYQLEEDLLQDEKELAEHNMLVDLSRNDLGRVCEFGSVKVTSYQDILKFSHVMHIGSTVEGELRKDCDAMDGIESVLPAGTLSGAPKIKACSYINEIENNKRGVYGGAVGYLDFTGNMDTCIGIRLAFKKNNKIFIRSGAGIVADSIGEKEYEECMNKAQALLRALNQVDKMEGRL
ncbi:anthranilate synthase component 1 [Aequitasia blattaphilus]|uniref:Anthranilate synthase component 1 n=1 Tax=Aequitasia blattaphilus TaxID=2949332 RepID=A0ABT1E6W2_9FIRM|nr:anthranilate synthase component I [Aequitasia blattaphilus]MCP1101575.1 anthranilate synthase component I [Aequitasia blattaphilus]MCR8614215.1 anthranilate synthase component I [Aequitasia blattaphilus]